MKTYTIRGVEDFKLCFKDFNECLQKSNVVLFSGHLGVGKTTFVKEYIKCQYKLNEQELVKAGVSSPTFAIQNHYEIDGDAILHFDFYRVEKGEYDLENHIEELSNATVSFVEWPEKVNFKSVFSDMSFIEINLEIKKDESRSLTLKS